MVYVFDNLESLFTGVMLVILIREVTLCIRQKGSNSVNKSSVLSVLIPPWIRLLVRSMKKGKSEYSVKRITNSITEVRSIQFLNLREEGKIII